MGGRFKREIGDFLCVVPALIITILFSYIPLVQLFYYSLTDWNLLSSEYSLVGLQNYQWLLAGNGSQYVWLSLQVTVTYTVGVLFLVVIGGLLLALLFSKSGRLFRFLRPIVFLPRYVSTSCAAIVFLWVLNSNNGILNQTLSLVKLESQDWLGQRETALIALILISAWKNIGYGMLIYLSAMSSIPKRYYEAASLDGAGKFIQFTAITLPALRPTIAFLTITSFIASMKAFQTIDIMTEGGPFRSTEVIVYLIYRYAFVDFRMGRACALSVVLLSIIAVLTFFMLKAIRQEGSDEIAEG